MLPGPVTRSTGAQRAALGQVDAVGEHRDRLGAADGVHLVDAEQGAGGEDRRVRPAAEVPLRRRHHGERLHAGHLRRDDVHDHAAGVDGASAGHVQADPVDRQPALGDGAARHDRRGDVDAPLVEVHAPGPVDGLQQGGAHGRLERIGGSRAVAPTGTRSEGGRTPSSFSVQRSTAAAPSARTSSMMGRIRSPASATSMAARGTTSRGSACEPRRSMRRITRLPYAAVVPAPLPLFPLNTAAGARAGAAPAHLRAPLPRAGRGAAREAGRGRPRVRHRGRPRRARRGRATAWRRCTPSGRRPVLRQAERLDDGRFEIVTTGSRRFRLLEVDDPQPLLRATVEFLDDVSDPADALLAEQVSRRFRLYRDALSGQVPEAVDVDDPDEDAELPDDPTVLSYLVTAAMVLPTDERQGLLAAPTTGDRLVARPHPARTRDRAHLHPVRGPVPRPPRRRAVGELMAAREARHAGHRRARSGRRSRTRRTTYEHDPRADVLRAGGRRRAGPAIPTRCSRPCWSWSTAVRSWASCR